MIEDSLALLTSKINQATSMVDQMLEINRALVGKTPIIDGLFQEMQHEQRIKMNNDRR